MVARHELAVLSELAEISSRILGLEKMVAGGALAAALQPRFRAGKILWTAADDELLRQRYPHEPTKVLANELHRSIRSVSLRAKSFGLKKTAEYLATCRLRRGNNVGAPYRFPKGNIPYNKGLRRPGYAPGRMASTQFKKGQLPWTYMPIGSTRLVEGYVYRKVSDKRYVPWTQNWAIEHYLVWEAAHGPIPAGHVVAFKNGDKTDIRLDNLELITRRELMARNTVHNLPAPLRQTIQLLGVLKRQINRRTNEKPY
jgi:hypothetical protein